MEHTLQLGCIETLHCCLAHSQSPQVLGDRMIAQRIRRASSQSGNAKLPLGLDQCLEEMAIFDCVGAIVDSSGLGSHFRHLQRHNVFPLGSELVAAYLICFFEADLSDDLWVQCEPQ